MKFNEDSKISEVLGNQDASDIVGKYVPGFKTHPMLGMALGMSLKDVAAIPMSGISPEMYQAILNELKELG